MHEIGVGAGLLASNQTYADQNRCRFGEQRLYVVNLMSAPGAGKTSLLERTIDSMSPRFRIGVIEGDLQTRSDAERIERHGVPVVQINTGGACHLDARQIQRELAGLPIDQLDMLVIENVGNLVCPADFDLGEHDKVMLLSVTEGEDKPQKYPAMFSAARALLLNKIDLLPHLDFDLAMAERSARALNPDLDLLRLSARSGEGLESWYDWLERRIAQIQSASPA